MENDSLKKLITSVITLSVINNKENKEKYINDLKLMFVEENNNVKHEILDDFNGNIIYKSYLDDTLEQTLITLKINRNEIKLKKDFLWDLNGNDLSEGEETEITDISIDENINISRKTGHNTVKPGEDCIYYDNMDAWYGLKERESKKVNDSNLKDKLLDEIKDFRKDYFDSKESHLSK